MTVAARRIDVRADPDVDLDPVVAHLHAGGVIAYPTETVYGLGSACTEPGVGRVLGMKGRDGGKPLIVLVQSQDAASGLIWNEGARALADVFWPGALTLVLADPVRIFPPGVRHPRTGAVAVRVSSHPIAARLVRALGAPLTSTSLNLPGRAAATTGSEALEWVLEVGGDEVVVLDAGALPPSRPSTVVDCTGPVPVVVREGSVAVARLRCVIPEIH